MKMLLMFSLGALTLTLTHSYSYDDNEDMPAIGGYYAGAAGGKCSHESHVIRSRTECSKALQELSIQSTGDYWTGRHNGIPSGCSIRISSQQPHLETSTGGLGWKNNAFRPICKNTWSTGELFSCYRWSKSDLQTITKGSRLMGAYSPQLQRKICEQKFGNTGTKRWDGTQMSDRIYFVFSHGDEKKAPGCGGCWCCMPNI